MKQHSHFDEFLREQAAEFRPAPPSRQKDRFMLAATSAPRQQTTRTKGLYLSLAALMLLLGTAALYFTLQTGDLPAEADTAQINTQLHSTEEKANLIPSKNPAAEERQTPAGVKKSHKSLISNDYETKACSPSTQQAGQSAAAQFNTEDQTAANAAQTDKPVAPQIAAEDAAATRITDNTEAAKSEMQEAGSPDAEHKKPARAGKSLPARHLSVISLYYAPELIFNIIENEKFIHNFGLSYQVELFDGRYIIGTGLGLSISKGYYEYAMEYKEFLGTFSKLDSISFAFDPERFEMTSTIHTSETQVFADEISTDYKRVYRQFRYLQIPLILGYNFASKEKYSMGIRFSPILNILLDKTTVDPNFDPGLNQLVQINRITPERVQTNWQLAAGFNYTRNLGNHLRMEVEPGFKYYFNSVYQKSDHTEPPYGFVLRMAIGFK